MKIAGAFLILILLLGPASTVRGAEAAGAKKTRILVVSSYHREYQWSIETNEGLCAAMLKFGYFDTKDQIAEYTKHDYVETSKLIMKKAWMDAKRKRTRAELVQRAVEITKIAKDFNPALIFLGDDDAAQYIGSQFLDTRVPVVFWGVNNNPAKYGLVNTAERPGHNVTGVYQPGYYAESLALLKKIVPSAKTFAVVTDDTTAGRSHYKSIEHLARNKALPLTLVETVITGDFEEFKSRVLKLQTKVDAFFIAQYSSLMDKSGGYVSAHDIARWYLANVRIPETAEQGQFVRQGMLCGADDSGYNQGYNAVAVAHDILSKGANPAIYPVRAPRRGALIVNRERAKMLGIDLNPAMGIEEYVDEAEVLKEVRK